METTLEELRSKSNWLMTTLKQHPHDDDTYQVVVNFSSYSSLFATITDLMKLTAVALFTDEPYVSPLVGDTTIDLSGIMELAIQLMPHSEAEFLDEVRMMVKKEPEQELPLFNYSTEVVIKKAAC
jgi:hypothetical protein